MYKVDIDEMIKGTEHMIDIAQKKIDNGLLYKNPEMYHVGQDDKVWFKRLTEFLKNYKENDKLSHGRVD